VVTELKPPVGDSPGFLMFTHKEREYFLSPSDPLAERIRRLKDHYVFGMQWGSYHDNVGETPFVDVQFGCPGTVDFRADADVRHVPMCSRDFTPAYFRPMDVPQDWDIMAVGHPIRIKRMHELLDVIRDLYDHGHEVRALLICAVPDDPGELGPRWDHDFFEKYETLFSPAERENLHLAAPVQAQLDHRPLHPIPNEVFPHLYNASQTFTLFSQQEGQSKVIHEALLCGTPVVVREDLRGGGRAYLDDRNSRTFGDLDEAREAFVDLLASDDPGFDPSYLRPDICAEYTTGDFEVAIRSVYAELDRPFAGEVDTDNLAFKLGGHTLTLPPKLRKDRTNDLRSRTAFYEWAGRKLGDRGDVRDRTTVRVEDARQRAADLRSGGAVGVGAELVWRLDRRLPVDLFGRAKSLYKRTTGE
jgi:glycosyltransferase involved in cell wall biosynthesis